MASSCVWLAALALRLAAARRFRAMSARSGVAAAPADAGEGGFEGATSPQPPGASAPIFAGIAPEGSGAEGRQPPAGTSPYGGRRAHEGATRDGSAAQPQRRLFAADAACTLELPTGAVPSEGHGPTGAPSGVVPSEDLGPTGTLWRTSVADGGARALSPPSPSSSAFADAGGFVGATARQIARNPPDHEATSRPRPCGRRSALCAGDFVGATTHRPRDVLNRLARRATAAVDAGLVRRPRRAGLRVQQRPVAKTRPGQWTG